MEKGTYKNYRICPQCGKKLPLTREYFKRYKDYTLKNPFHEICRKCEEKNKYNKEWKDGKLLCHQCGEYKDINQFSPNGSSLELRQYRRYVLIKSIVQKVIRKIIFN